MTTSATGLSAKGTRLNRKGLETRDTVLRVAIECLADGGPEAVSANLVAKRAEVTWGTLQHQFGDVDGLWAAVFERVAGRTARGPLVPPPAPEATLEERVHGLVLLIWNALQRPGVRAIHHLRQALPRDRATLEASYPKTATQLQSWDTLWDDAVHAAFADLDLDPLRVARVRTLLPGAVRGMYDEQYLSSYADMDDARVGLADALVAYLSPRR